MGKSKKQQKLSNLECASFCSQMTMVLHAGFPAVEGVSLLLEDAKDVQEKAILQVMYDEMINTGLLYPALEKTGVFPDYLLQMVKIGEETGTLDDVMNGLTHHYEREDEIEKSIKSALTYPLIMVAMMIAVIVILLTKVMPVFEQVFRQLGRQMTGFSGGMLALGKTISNYAIVFIAIAAVIVGVFVYFVKSSRGQRAFAGFSRKMHLFHGLYDKIAACRFADSLYLTLKSGQNPQKGLEFADELIADKNFSKKIKKCSQKMEEGEDFAAAVGGAGIFEGLYERMLVISGKTGETDETLETIARQYEREIDQRMSSYIAILEPTLVIILSVIVGMILLSVILPLMGIMAGL